MKKIFFILITLLVLSSCDNKYSKFKYHVSGSNIKHIGEFSRGLSVGDTTSVKRFGITYVCVLDSLIK